MRQPHTRVTPGSRGMRGGSWRPPETDEEREARESYITPARARQIRLEIEADPLTHAEPAAPPTACGQDGCTVAPDGDCYLPGGRCGLGEAARAVRRARKSPTQSVDARPRHPLR